MAWHPDMPLEYRNQIVTGDARELAKAIPDESIDLVFTDPIYSNIDDYRWLAEMAVRVLRPGGACLVWSNGKWHKLNTEWLEMCGLTYRWDFAYVKAGVNVGGFCGKVMLRCNRLVWLDIDRQSKMKHALIDGFIGTAISGMNFNHGWVKDPQYCTMALESFSMSTTIVFDPFTGGGTVPAVCKMLGRNYIAFEIDPITADNARERVRNTQPPLFVLEPEQMEFELNAH